MIDLTKGRKLISHTVYPNGVKGDYYPPGFKISIPTTRELTTVDWGCGILTQEPSFCMIELTPREYYESMLCPRRYGENEVLAQNFEEVIVILNDPKQ